jgi:hypothetical protein
VDVQLTGSASVGRTNGLGTPGGTGVGVAAGGGTGVGVHSRKNGSWVAVAVGVGEAAMRPKPAGVGEGNTGAPPPTKVGQSPQPSVTVSSTVAASPAAICRTVRSIDAGRLGKLTVAGVVLTVVTGEVATSTVAFASRVNWSATS